MQAQPHPTEYGQSGPSAIGEVADGLLFLSEGHEYSPPLFIGAKQLAINCTTGELAWCN